MSEEYVRLIKTPCDVCSNPTCHKNNACGKWDYWFKQYWKALRKKYLPKGVRK